MFLVQVSPISTASCSSATLRRFCSTSCTPGSFLLYLCSVLGSPNFVVPGRTGLSRRSGSSNSVSTASSRKPDTPRLYHQRVTSNIAFSTAGLFQFKSGCSA